MNSHIRSVDILGARVDCITTTETLDLVNRQIEEGREAAIIVASNPEKVYALRRFPALRLLYQKAAVVLPDGVGIVAAARVLYGLRIRRVAGADLMEQLLQEAGRKKYSVFLFGASESVNARVAELVASRYRGVRIAGRKCGYCGARTEASQIVAEINASGANILFVALGSPLQELWVAEHMNELRVAVIQCVGGSFDVIAGEVRRAPKLFRRVGCEWLFRLLSQPQRAHRQLNLLRFAWDIVQSSRSAP